MEFLEMRNRMTEHFLDMTKEAEKLFEINLDKDVLWNLYLDSFPAGKNEIFRERREHDCSCCRHFIKAIGNAVVIKDNKIITIWDFRTDDDTYQPVLDALAEFVKCHVVTDVWLSNERTVGVKENYELIDGKTHKWDHFYLELPDKFVNRSRDSIATIKGDLRASRNVFKRSLDEITMEAVDTVLELISQKSLYRGEEWKGALEEFRKLKKEYDAVPDAEKENYTWVKSLKIGVGISRIRNHSIGTLLVDISNDVDLDEAVRKYEVIVAPANYKRPKEIFTKRMLEEAQQTITELGYMSALGRRFATLDDITVNNILFSNKDSAKRIGGADIFAEMAKDVAVNPKKFSKVEEISIETFVNDVLPTAKELEVLFENKHTDNLVSLIAPMDAEAPSMFKWPNPFSWAYTGNMTDSMMKERVKAAGGKVDGDLRFSIQWNDTKEYSRNDVDAHCICPNGFRICYSSKNDPTTKGQLDVDIRYPAEGKPAVENITWANRNTMKPGTYKFFVHQFSNRGGRDGFRAEIEFDGQIYSFDYSRELKQGEMVAVAEVTLSKDGQFSIVEKLPSNMSTREVWGVKTNQFMPVSTVMFSPNYWDEQIGIGHKHYFFMLKDCINPENPNGMYNEYLKEELLKHKRVFAALGSRCKVEDAEDQLSGIGFSSTKRAELVVKVKGTTERVLKIKF